ncbi:MAG: hypothetical protein AB7S70_10090 [Hyphomicrobium sp.]
MMECKFVVGQKVVCIAVDEGKWILADTRQPSPHIPKHGVVYKVTGIIPSSNHCGVPLISLAEFPPNHFFQHNMFRPLLDRPKEADTDISIFRKILDGAPVKEPV